MNQAQETQSKNKNGIALHDAQDAVKERLEQARDVVEDVRERAESLFREKPYMVPVAAGAAGFALGMLFGSKIMRFVVFTAVGTVMSDMVGGEVKRLAGDFVKDMQNRLAEGEGQGEAE